MTSSCTDSIELQWSTLHHPILFPQTADLKYLLRQYEHWANFMYPKMTFKDVTERIERLATKKEFKVQQHMWYINSCHLLYAVTIIAPPNRTAITHAVTIILTLSIHGSITLHKKIRGFENHNFKKEAAVHGYHKYIVQCGLPCYIGEATWQVTRGSSNSQN